MKRARRLGLSVVFVASLLPTMTARAVDPINESLVLKPYSANVTFTPNFITVPGGPGGPGGPVGITQTLKVTGEFRVPVIDPSINVIGQQESFTFVAGGLALSAGPYIQAAGGSAWAVYRQDGLTARDYGNPYASNGPANGGGIGHFAFGDTDINERQDYHNGSLAEQNSGNLGYVSVPFSVTGDASVYSNYIPPSGMALWSLIANLEYKIDFTIQPPEPASGGILLPLPTPIAPPYYPPVAFANYSGDASIAAAPPAEYLAGLSPELAALVPEPSSASILLIAATAGLIGRRRRCHAHA